MFRFFACLAVFAAVAGLTARADDKPIVPKTPPPEFLTVNEFDTGKEELTVAVVRTQVVQKTGTRQVQIMGQNVTQTYTYSESVPVSMMMRRSTSGARYLTADGKEIKKASAIQMLKKGTVILWTEWREGVDPLYLKALAKDTLIVIGQPVLP